MSIAALTLLVMLGQRVDPKLHEIISRIDRPFPEDRMNLEKYGDQAFQLLLPMAKSRLAEMHRAKLERNRKAEDTWGDRARNVVEPLLDCAKPHRTPEMVDLYEKYPEWPCHRILPWIVSDGNPQGYWNLFARIISKAKASKERELGNYEAYAVDGLIKADSNRAIKFLTPLLLDKAVHGHIRAQILFDLPPTRHVDALAAVRLARKGSRVIVPLLDRVAFPTPKEPATAVASNGAKWALAEWNALGSPSDLWAVQIDGRVGRNIAFTGHSNYWPNSLPSGTPVKGFHEHQQKIASFKAGKSWAGSDELKKDSDADGYTNVVENWYGLNPDSKDTDGDGILDGIDKNPFAKIIPTTDEELAVAAVFDGFAIKEKSLVSNMFVSLPKGMRPIEFALWPGLVFHEGAEFKEPTRAGALFGIRLSFTDIKLNPSRNSAEVSVTESGGWYMNFITYKLEKTGADWFVMGVKHQGSAVS